MLYLRVFTRNQQFQAIHGDICATILNFGDESRNEWNLYKMEHVLHSMDLSVDLHRSKPLISLVPFNLHFHCFQG